MSWNPQGLSRPVMGLISLFLHVCLCVRGGGLFFNSSAYMWGFYLREVDVVHCETYLQTKGNGTD